MLRSLVGSEMCIRDRIHTRFRDSIASGIHYKSTANYVDYSTATTHRPRDIVQYNSNFYICHTQTTGTFNSSKWHLITGAEYIDSNTFEFNITKNIPDVIKLHRYSQLGNSIRPYAQGWFRDIYEARRTFIKKTNQLLLNVDISSLPNWGDILNQTAYILFDETIDLTKYWTLVDYQSEGYDSTKEITLTVSKLAEIYTSYVTVNSYIKVLEDKSIYEKDVDGGFKVVYRTADKTNQRGAIKLSDELFDPKGTWDGSKWNAINIPWDFDFCNIFYAITEALRNNLFVDTYKVSYSKMMCAMFRYVLSEQTNVDWLQKSSTIEPINLINRNLDKMNTLRRDDIDIFSNFYTSVKSYRDKIRSSTVNKQLIENTNLSMDETLSVEDTEINIGYGGELAGEGTIFN